MSSFSLICRKYLLKRKLFFFHSIVFRGINKTYRAARCRVGVSSIVYTLAGVRTRAAPGRAYTHVGQSVNEADDCLVQGPPRRAMKERHKSGRPQTNFNMALDEIREEEEEECAVRQLEEIPVSFPHFAN